MSAALLLTVAMAGAHDCPTYTSQHYAAPYNYNYSYGTPYGYSYGMQYGYGYAAPGYRYYGSPSPGYAYGSSRRSYPGGAGYQERTAGYTPQPASGMNVVQMTDRARFEPAQITVNVGDTVEWRNVSHHPHTVTANAEMAKNAAHVVLPEGVEPFDSGEVAPGGRFSHKFTAAGTYFYICQPHEEKGMVGIVVVKEREGAQPEGQKNQPEASQPEGQPYQPEAGRQPEARQPEARQPEARQPEARQPEARQTDTEEAPAEVIEEAPAEPNGDQPARND